MLMIVLFVIIVYHLYVDDCIILVIIVYHLYVDDCIISCNYCLSLVC